MEARFWHQQSISIVILPVVIFPPFLSTGYDWFIEKLKVARGRKYFINVGSVGQPRDGDPRASYVIYDMINNSIELRRINYDFVTTQQKILERGLPERLASRLAIGR